MQDRLQLADVYLHGDIITVIHPAGGCGCM